MSGKNILFGSLNGQAGRFASGHDSRTETDRRTRFHMGAVTAIIFCLLCSSCAMSDDVALLHNRLSRVEKDQKKNQTADRTSSEELKKATDRLNSRIESLEKTQQGKEQVLRSHAAELRVVVNHLQDQVQILSGRLEETEFLLKREMERLSHAGIKKDNRLDEADNTSRSLHDRMMRVERYLNLEPLSSEKTDGSGPLAEKPLTETDIYSSAKKAYDQGSFQTAREGFQQLIEKFPASGHADNAQFWIGETYYREKWYEKAILEYQKVIEKYPQGNKIRASLLKQGFAFYNLKDKANARLILKELIKKHPRSNEAAVARKKIAEISP